MMFDGDLLKLWCQLYQDFVIADKQRLIKAIDEEKKNNKQTFNAYLTASFNSEGIASLLKKSNYQNIDYLTAYSQLLTLDKNFGHSINAINESDSHFFNKTHPHVFLNNTRYLLANAEQHPIVKAIPKPSRYKLNVEIGNDRVLHHLKYQWIQIDRSEQISRFRSDIFDSLVAKSATKLKIALSPVASSSDMQWIYQNEYFWCTGAKNESELQAKMIQILEQSYQENVQIVIFPELVMTENLQSQIRTWLQQNNIEYPIIRLIVAGTRHVFTDSNNQNYVNRCFVFDSEGKPIKSLKTGETWEQDKHETFRLNPHKAEQLFGIKSELLEPSCRSEKAIICHTALGRIATPICLDFLKNDGIWQKLPIDIFLVPAMSDSKEGLNRFENNSVNAGGKWGSAVFVCNAMPDDDHQAVYVYLPSTENLPAINKLSPYLLFITELDIDMK